MRINYVFISFCLIICMIFTVSAQKKTNKYVGVKKCKTCHKKKEDGEQYKIWSEGPHANAMKTLSNEKSMKYAKDNGIADPAKEPKCLKCHSTVYESDKSLHEKTLTVEEGVSCESCHGPGSSYKTKKVMKDHKLAIENGLIIPNEKTCIKCHNEKDNPFFKPFDFEKRKQKIAHQIPEKKLQKN